jgi:hypothetical protein
MIDKDKFYDRWSKLGLLDGLDNVQKNWMDQVLVNDREFGEGIQPLDNKGIKDKPDFSGIIFPIVRRVSAQTLACGGWKQSNRQKLKQDRLNKLRKLQGDEPNIVLPDDEYTDGLVSVQPLSSPSPQLFYMDYNYTTNSNYGPYNSKSEALSNIIMTRRYENLTVIIENTEYWFKGGLEDKNLVIKNNQKLRKEKLMELNKINI